MARLPSRILWCLLVAGTLASACAAQTPLTRQNLYDVGPNMPEHYTARVALFEAEPVVTGRVVFLGNSITEGGDWARLTGDSTAVNRGIGGDVTSGVLRRLDDVVRRRPAKLFLLIGVNDIAKDIPEAVIADNVRKIVDSVRVGSPETAVYVQSVLPVNPTVDRFPQHYDKGDHVLRLNVLLREVATAAGVHYVDLYPVFCDAQGLLDARLTYDGLHLNAAGYERWVAHLRAMGYL